MGLQHLAPGSVGRRPRYLQQRQYPQQRQLSRQYATAAAQLAAEDGEEEEVAVGSILEFERGREYHIGRAIKPLAGAQGWQVEAARCDGRVSRAQTTLCAASVPPLWKRRSLVPALACLLIQLPCFRPSWYQQNI